MMDEAVDEALRSGKTADVFLWRVFFARRVNQYFGGAVVTPWELDGLGDWVTVMEAVFSAGEREKQRARLDGLRSEFRKRHPTFRK